MAKEPKAADKTIEVDDDALVTLELEPGEELPDTNEDGEVVLDDGEPDKAEVVEPVKKPIERVRLKTKSAAEGEDEDPEGALKAALQADLEKSRRETATAKAAVEAERRQREDAQRRLTQTEQERDEARDNADARQLSLLTGNIESTERALASQQVELRAAMEAGDFEKTASLQVKISQSAAKLDRLTADKESFDEKIKTRPKEPVTEGRVEQQPQPGAMVSRYLAQFAPVARSWIQEHTECYPPELGGEALSHNRMMQGHYAAVNEGIEPNSPEYFERIEEVLANSKVEEKPAPKPAPKPRAVQPSAPVTRDPPSAVNGSTEARTVHQVRLTPEQQEAAKMSFPDKADKEAFALYARNLIELRKEGKMGRTTH